MRHFRALMVGVLAGLVLLSGTAVQATVYYDGSARAPIMKPSAHTASATIVHSESGNSTTITNGGASGSITLTLPACSSASLADAYPNSTPTSNVGEMFQFYAAAAQVMVIAPATGDQLLPYTSAVSTSMTSDGLQGDSITVVCAATNVWVVRGAVGFSAPAGSVNFVSGVRFVAHTAADTLVAGDLMPNVIHTNTGAAASRVWVLPACTTALVGMTVNVLLTAAQDVDLDPNIADTITGVGIAGSAGDQLSSAGAIGDFLTLTCTANTKWTMGNISGVWTDAN